MPSMDVPSGKLSADGMGPDAPDPDESAPEPADDDSLSPSSTGPDDPLALADAGDVCPSLALPAAPHPARTTSKVTANTVTIGFIL